MVGALVGNRGKLTKLKGVWTALMLYEGKFPGTWTKTEMGG